MRVFKTLLRKPKIHAMNVTLTSYSGDKIPTHGSCMLEIKHKDFRHKVFFVVEKNDVISILGEKR